MTENEIWLEIPGYEKLYEVSNLGRIRNIAARKGSFIGRILPAYMDSWGRPRVKLYTGAQQFKTIRVHMCVARAFIPVPERLNNIAGKGRIEVNHIDGDKTNNIATNLEWCSSKENSQHAARMGKSPAGKLTLEQVKEIKEILKYKFDCKNIPSITSIAAKYGVTPRNIRAIREGRSWSHVIV